MTKTTTVEGELLPCPFCGGEATYFSELNYSRIGCDDCGTVMPKFSEPVTTINFDARRDAQGAWNTRPKPDVEKVARAIYDQRMKNEVFGIDTPAFDDIPDNFKEMFMLEAEAAIKAGSE